MGNLEILYKALICSADDPKWNFAFRATGLDQLSYHLYGKNIEKSIFQELLKANVS